MLIAYVWLTGPTSLLPEIAIRGRMPCPERFAFEGAVRQGFGVGPPDRAVEHREAVPVGRGLPH